MPIDKCNDIGNRTRDLPACSIVPQSTTECPVFLCMDFFFGALTVLAGKELVLVGNETDHDPCRTGVLTSLVMLRVFTAYFYTQTSSAI
jgi:hypothetical protein